MVVGKVVASLFDGAKYDQAMERAGLKCSFCGLVKPGGVAGPTTATYICPACIELTHELVHKRDGGEGPSEP
jgi:hypothetical protein